MIGRIVWGVLLGAAGIGAGLAVLALIGGRWSARLDALSHPAPVYAALGAFLLATAFLAAPPVRDRLVACALIMGVSGVMLMAPELLRSQCRAAAVSAPRALKVIQFNVWGGNASPLRVVQWLKAQDPDIVVLQEAILLRAPLVSAGYHLACAGCSAMIFSKQAPVEAGSTAALPPFGDMIAFARYDHPHGDFAVVAVHRSWPIKFDRLRLEDTETSRVLDRLPRSSTILAGDFNAAPWSYRLRRFDRDSGLIRRTVALATWPADRLSHYRLPAPFPFMPIDHVYAGKDWRLLSVSRGPRLGSDHFPVVLTLERSANPSLAGVAC